MLVQHKIHCGCLVASGEIYPGIGAAASGSASTTESPPEKPGGGTAVAPRPRKEKAAEPSKTSTKSETQRGKPGLLPPYHVVLLNDNDHTYEYVIEMLRALFGHPIEEGFRLAEEVDRRGRAVVLTTHKEKAELKRDQIHAYGADSAVATCCGSMSAVIIPAER